MDEPATAQALAGAVLRGMDCGASTPEEVSDLTGVDRARLEVLARRAPSEQLAAEGRPAG
jgi:hypothetical protein